MKRGVRLAITIAVIIVVILVLVLALRLTGNVIYSATMVTRTMSSSMNMNTEYQVTLAITTPEVYALGITENIPEGWQVTSVSQQGIIKTNKIEWLFAPGKSQTAWYKIIPINSNNQFSGQWFSASPDDNEDISGTNKVTIIGVQKGCNGMKCSDIQGAVKCDQVYDNYRVKLSCTVNCRDMISGGTDNYCSRFSSYNDCTTHYPCNWIGPNSGGGCASLHPCSSLTPDKCDSLASLGICKTSCSGESCSGITNQDDCIGRGCSWE